MIVSPWFFFVWVRIESNLRTFWQMLQLVLTASFILLLYFLPRGDVASICFCTSSKLLKVLPSGEVNTEQSTPIFEIWQLSFQPAGTAASSLSLHIFPSLWLAVGHRWFNGWLYWALFGLAGHWTGGLTQSNFALALLCQISSRNLSWHILLSWLSLTTFCVEISNVAWNCLTLRKIALLPQKIRS